MAAAVTAILVFGALAYLSQLLVLAAIAILGGAFLVWLVGALVAWFELDEVNLE